MKKKSLCALIALGLVSGVVQAQDYDDRWYVAPTMGFYHSDGDRGVNNNTLFAGIGMGRYFAPNTSLDIFTDYTERGLEFTSGKWGNLALGASIRHYFGDGNWKPYVMGGLGMSRHDVHLSPQRPLGSTQVGWEPMLQLGAGLQRMIDDNNMFRTELAYRHDFDEESIVGEDNFGDWTLGVGFTHAFGDVAKAAPEAPEAPKEMEKPAETNPDNDNDGVVTIEDKCPDSPAGSVVGPDGCPQAITIDLRGVEFKFDRPKSGETEVEPTLKDPSSEGMGILNNAVTTLKQYPNLKVEVAGHTDFYGTDAYNMDLSQRRVNVVAEYLKAQGVNADQLTGMMGYGESKPIDTNDTREGRQRNRRTELNAQK